MNTSIMSDVVLKNGALVMIVALRVPGRVTGVVKDRRETKYSVRYRVSNNFREAIFTRGQLTLIVGSGGKDA